MDDIFSQFGDIFGSTFGGGGRFGGGGGGQHRTKISVKSEINFRK
jgi:molecular chaperone DnaJ